MELSVCKKALSPTKSGVLPSTPRFSGLFTGAWFATKSRHDANAVSCRQTKRLLMVPDSVATVAMEFLNLRRINAILRKCRPTSMHCLSLTKAKEKVHTTPSYYLAEAKT